ncbi:response regulator [Piscinibacter terrae]|uniref:Response regulator n=1 Tax=Piscinibacter terrae TaxID=2496871 RepID=A0A3N7HIM9_9BURK|nr:response regulator [Albitalea terrae]RQP21878.1 response regulator [Albitalea terrae]
MRILLIEDNLPLSSWLSQALRRGGYTVDCASDGETATHLLLGQQFDAAILDMGLPRMPGPEVLRRVRARGINVPILVLTAEGGLQARIAGLDAGADDYLPKPFDVGELEARLRAIIRRKSDQKNPEIACGTLSYNSNTRLFCIGAQELKLTPREHAVLEILIHNIGKTVSKTSLADGVFSLGDESGPTTVEVYMSRLRKKLTSSDARIFTLRGLGYLLKQSSAAADLKDDGP